MSVCRPNRQEFLDTAHHYSRAEASVEPSYHQKANWFTVTADDITEDDQVASASVATVHSTVTTDNA